MHYYALQTQRLHRTSVYTGCAKKYIYSPPYKLLPITHQRLKYFAGVLKVNIHLPSFISICLIMRKLL